MGRVCFGGGREIEEGIIYFTQSRGRGYRTPQIMKSPKKYSIGDAVLFVPPIMPGQDHPTGYEGNQATLLPAFIVRTWEGKGYQNDEVNVKILTDGHGDQ